MTTVAKFLLFSIFCFTIQWQIAVTIIQIMKKRRCYAWVQSFLPKQELTAQVTAYRCSKSCVKTTRQSRRLECSCLYFFNGPSPDSFSFIFTTNKWVNVHTVHGTGIWTYDLNNMSLLPLPLDQGLNSSASEWQKMKMKERKTYLDYFCPLSKLDGPSYLPFYLPNGQRRTLKS